MHLCLPLQRAKTGVSCKFDDSLHCCCRHPGSEKKVKNRSSFLLFSLYAWNINGLHFELDFIMCFKFLPQWANEMASVYQVGDYYSLTCYQGSVLELISQDLAIWQLSGSTFLLKLCISSLSQCVSFVFLFFQKPAGQRYILQVWSKWVLLPSHTHHTQTPSTVNTILPPDSCTATPPSLRP